MGLVYKRHLGARNEVGAGKRNRTSDLRVTNALLYQLSYSGAENALDQSTFDLSIELGEKYKRLTFLIDRSLASRNW